MKTIKNNHKGAVSFMVTIIMMLVISLIVIGFTQVVNRARKDALDRQLSAAAFYAAESGVNSVVKQIMNAGADIPTQTDCDGTDYTKPALNGTDVMVTCVLVKSVADKITTSAAQNISTVVNVVGTDENSSGHKNPDKLTFSWAPATPSTNVAACNTAFGGAGGFPPSGGGCQWGVLRLDLFQYSNGDESNTIGSDDYDRTMTVYAKPTTSGSATADINFTDKVKISSAAYSGGKFSVTLNLTNGAGNKKYYIRMSTLYRDAPAVEITGTHSSGTALYFKNAQATIDVTAKAQDVLRRVQVKYPIGIGKDLAAVPYAVASGETVCKQLTVVNNNEVIPSCP